MNSIFLSEVFTLSLSNSNFACFELNPKIKQNDGNKLSFHLNRNLPRISVIWHQGYFYALSKIGKVDNNKLSEEEWQEILESVQDLLKDYKERCFQLKLIEISEISPKIKAQLACQVLSKTQFDMPDAIPPINQVVVKRELDYKDEIIEINGQIHPALSLTLHSPILYLDNLEKFYSKFNTNDPDVLIGLQVRDREVGSYGKIIGCPGTVEKYRDRLIEQTAFESTKKALKNAPKEQPIVSVRYNNGDQREYPLVRLRPCVTPETADRFGEVKYGDLLKATKIPYEKRATLLNSYKLEVQKALKDYGFQLAEKCVNSKDNNKLFYRPSFDIETVPLLFGNNVRGVRGKILAGLSKGVYRRHQDFTDSSRLIRIATLKICDLDVQSFTKQVQEHLNKYKFKSQIITEKDILIKSFSEAQARLEIDRAVDELINLSHDIVLVFLPQSDRNTDHDVENTGSLYHRIYDRLLKRRVASQFIYADTFTTVEHRQILNQIIPGILAKLGNLPFILAERLEIADYFIGLDISRERKRKSPGSNNACGSVRLYGKQGEFIQYQLEDETIEGEEIPGKFLEKFFNSSDLKDKVVLIYRDGLFRGNEAKFLKNWAKAIGSKFILVECIKSGVPRLYNWSQKKVVAPDKGSSLLLSSHEAILVTTKVPPKIGLARPLRLRIHEEGEQVAIEKVIETTLKLTLLHHGALQTPRLPMPIYGADRMAYLRLRGIYPTSWLVGDRQFWL